MAAYFLRAVQGGLIGKGLIFMRHFELDALEPIKHLGSIYN